MKLSRVFVLASTLFVSVGCTPSQQQQETKPVATTSVIADTQGVIPRFTQDIWPVMLDYSMYGDQGTPTSASFNKIIDKNLDLDANSKLRHTVRNLNTIQAADQTHNQITSDDDGLHLATTDLTAETPTTATLQICYTYTADAYTVINVPPTKSPGASEATIALRKADNWYLHSLTNDHVVPSCSSSKA